MHLSTLSDLLKLLQNTEKLKIGQNQTRKPSQPVMLAANPSIRGVGAPMDGLSALPWTARWCQGTLPCWPLLADKPLSVEEGNHPAIDPIFNG